MVELADDISGATGELVERVLEEYGDPAETPPDEPTGPVSTDRHSLSDKRLPQLTADQVETLELIYEQPTASQRELAADLGVSHTTVYRRLQGIDGFEWAHRWEFVRAVIRGDAGGDDKSGSHDADEADVRAPHERCSIFGNPDLMRKVIDACLSAEDITDEEGRQITGEFFQLVADHLQASNLPEAEAGAAAGGVADD